MKINRKLKTGFLFIFPEIEFFCGDRNTRQFDGEIFLMQRLNKLEEH